VKVLSLICRKGGTSKTSTAINLAVFAASQGLEVIIVDLDPQVSACEWADIRGDKAPAVVQAAVPHLERTLKAAEANKVDLAIVDTAGHSNDAALAAARFSDLVLVNIQPSLVDLKTLKTTLDTIKAGGGPVTRAVLSRVRDSKSNRRRDAADWITEQGLEVSPVTLCERTVYQDAYAKGLGVTETEPKGKAADEIRHLYMYVSSLLGMSAKSAKGDTSRGRKSAKAVRA